MEEYEKIEKILNVLDRYDCYPEFYSEYAEPGYETDTGIFTADWNKVPRKFSDWLESEGYELEWLDEWTSCYECGKIVRTQPDSYCWVQSYAIIAECELVCHECICENPTEYIEELINNPDRVCTINDLDLSSFGFENMNGEFESGFYGTHDDPKEILKNFMEEFPDHEFIFNNFSSEQFRVNWEIWGRKVSEEEE